MKNIFRVAADGVALTFIGAHGMDLSESSPQPRWWANV